jgi:hypothetical protein
MKKLSDPIPDLVRTVATPVRLKPIPYTESGGKYPVLGGAFVPHLYCSSSLVGRVGSGKTSWLFNALDQCAGPETVVLIFSSTIYSDKGWIAILKWLEENRIAHSAYTSIYQTGKDGQRRNLISEFMEGCVAQGKIDLAKRESEGKAKPYEPGTPLGGNWGTEKDQKKEKEFLPTLDPYLVKIGGVKYQYAPFILIFDDLAEDLRDKQVDLLVRKYRHFHTKIFISSQHYVDANSPSRQNIRLWILFGGLGPSKLKLVYEASGPDCSLEKFERRYADATAEKYSTLVIDVENNKMYKGTEHEYLSLRPSLDA